MELKGTIKAGKLFTIESGEYSDYDVDGFFVALRDFRPHDEVCDYLYRHQRNESGRVNRYGFAAFLASKGLIMDVDYHRIHVGSYGDIREGDFDGERFSDCEPRDISEAKQ